MAGSIENLTAPEKIPRAVPVPFTTESQLAPGSTDAENVVAALEEIPTVNDPAGFPTGFPVTELNNWPANPSFITESGETESVAGTVAVPPPTTTVMAVE